MKNAFLYRLKSDDQGTPGIFIVPGFSFRTLELPDRNNKPNISRIPEGEYPCRLYRSPRFRTVYLVLNTSPRTWILFHPGNVAGDIEKGFKTHSQGCILVGKRFGSLKVDDNTWQFAVLNSRPTFNKFMAFMGDDEFKLTIKGGY